MSYSKASRHPHAKPVFERAPGSQDRPAGTGCSPPCPPERPCPSGSASREGCTGIPARHHGWHMVGTGAAWGEGVQVGQGKACGATQAPCPGLKNCSKAPQSKTLQCVTTGMLRSSGDTSTRRSGYVLVKIPENEATVFEANSVTTCRSNGFKLREDRFRLDVKRNDGYSWWVTPC